MVTAKIFWSSLKRFDRHHTSSHGDCFHIFRITEVKQWKFSGQASDKRTLLTRGKRSDAIIDGFPVKESVKAKRNNHWRKTCKRFVLVVTVRSVLHKILMVDIWKDGRNNRRRYKIPVLLEKSLTEVETRRPATSCIFSVFQFWWRCFLLGWKRFFLKNYSSSYFLIIPSLSFFWNCLIFAKKTYN